jgi:hypothetical protein
MAPHWPDALDKLSSGMRTQMVETFARPALLASRMFPDNKQLHKALYGHIQRHVFFNRQSPDHGPFLPALHLPLSFHRRYHFPQWRRVQPHLLHHSGTVFGMRFSSL